MVFSQKNEIDFPVFGCMRYRSYWLGKIYLNIFSDLVEVEVIVRAKQDGPSQKQIEAMSIFLSNIKFIKDFATVQILSLYQDYETSFELDQFIVWSDLKLFQIEVTDENFDSKTSNISILLLFSSGLIENFCPTIEVIDGQFVQVLSGA